MVAQTASRQLKIIESSVNIANMWDGQDLREKEEKVVPRLRENL